MTTPRNLVEPAEAGEELTMSEDKLTPEERKAVADLTAWMNNTAGLSSVAVQRALAAIDRLAPATKPPEPRVSELPARMRAAGQSCLSTGGDALLRYADELEAALKREGDAVRKVLADNSHKAFEHAVQLATECSALLIGGDMFRSIVSAVLVESEKRLRKELAP